MSFLVKTTFTFNKVTKTLQDFQKVTQTKHHWWWKANQVFDVLKSTKTFNGSFVFLEEDHLLAPDVLHLLRLMEQKKNVIAEKVILIFHIKVFLPLCSVQK